MELTIKQMQTLFEGFAHTAGVPRPTVIYSPREELRLNFFSVATAQFNPETNQITVYRSGRTEETIRHEFIHYLRFHLGLSANLETYFNRGVPMEKLNELHRYEESQTRRLNKLEWPQILSELKQEQINGNAFTQNR